MPVLGQRLNLLGIGSNLLELCRSDTPVQRWAMDLKKRPSVYHRQESRAFASRDPGTIIRARNRTDDNQQSKQRLAFVLSVVRAGKENRCTLMKVIPTGLGCKQKPRSRATTQ